ncbi:MAG: AAA family ATPase [Gemmatimonadales bacterium]|jgi:pilus assembly protein CpaE
MTEAPASEHEGRGSGPLRAFAFTTDRKLLSRLRGILTDAGLPIVVQDAITVPLRQVSRMRLHDLPQARPDLLFLDFSEEAEVGVSFAQYLAETIPSATIIGMGPELPPHLLIAAMQANVSKYLEVPLEREAVVSMLSRLNVQPGPPPEPVPASPRHRGRVLHLFSPKGGSGATTVTVNLAIALAEEKAGRVLVVDLDPELGDAALLLGVEPRFGVVDLVNSLGRFDASLLDSLVAKHESGVHLLSAPEDPQEVGLLSGREIGAVFEAVREHYDWLLVDTPKSLVTSTMAALDVADEVLLVTLLDILSLKKATRSQVLLRRLLGLGSETRLRLIVNRYSPDDLITLDDVQEALGLDVYQTLRNDYASVIQSINTGRPVRDGSPFARDVHKLAKKLIGAQGATEVAETRDGTLLQRAVRGSLRTVLSS